MKTFDNVQEAKEYSKNNPTETVESTEYYSDGQLDEHRFYVAGELHGECKLYYRNGQLMYHFFFVNGKNHGEYKEYNDDGQLMFHFFYADGVRNADLVHLAKDNRTHEETELVKAAVGDNYFK